LLLDRVEAVADGACPFSIHLSTSGLDRETSPCAVC
jgi:hypothetical protein